MNHAVNRLEFDTERLTLRSLTHADAPFLIELLNSDGWLTYIGDRNARTEAGVATYLTNGPLVSYAQYGFGLGRVSLKHDNTPIGLCGLLKRDYLPHPDIGYALLPQFTGQGYAVEIAQQTLDFAFDQLGLPAVQATVMPANTASIRVLEKLGMTLEGPIRPAGVGQELLLFGKQAPRPNQTVPVL